MSRRRFTRDFPPLPFRNKIVCFIIGGFLRLAFGALRITLHINETQLGHVSKIPSGQPVIFYTWHKFTIPMCLAASSKTQFNKVQVLFHDRVRSYMWVGTGNLGRTRALIFSFRSKKSPTEQIAEALLPGVWIATHPDSGSPYEKMRSGLVRVATATGAALVPIVPKCSKEWAFKIFFDHRIPKPGASIEIKLGSPVELKGDSVEKDTLRAEQALVDLVKKYEFSG